MWTELVFLDLRWGAHLRNFGEHLQTPGIRVVVKVQWCGAHVAVTAEEDGVLETPGEQGAGVLPCAEQQRVIALMSRVQVQARVDVHRVV